MALNASETYNSIYIEFMNLFSRSLDHRPAFDAEIQELRHKLLRLLMPADRIREASPEEVTLLKDLRELNHREAKLAATEREKYWYRLVYMARRSDTAPLSAHSAYFGIAYLMGVLFTHRATAKLAQLHLTQPLMDMALSDLCTSIQHQIDLIIPPDMEDRPATGAERQLLTDLRFHPFSSLTHSSLAQEHQDQFMDRLRNLVQHEGKSDQSSSTTAAVESDSVPVKKVNEVLIEIPDGLLNEHGHLTGYLDWFRSTGMVIPPDTRLVGLYKNQGALDQVVYCRLEHFLYADKHYVIQYLPEPNASNRITDDEVSEYRQGTVIAATYYPYVLAIPAAGETPKVIWDVGHSGYTEGMFQYSVGYLYMWIDRNLYAWWHALVQDKNNPKDSVECHRLWRDKTFATPLFDLSWRGKEAPLRPTREELEYFEVVRKLSRDNVQPSVEWIDAFLREMLSLTNVNWLAASE